MGPNGASSWSAVPTAVPTNIRSGRFAGALSPASRMMMSEDATFALGF
jgi:hypothetical protein